MKEVNALVVILIVCTISLFSLGTFLMAADTVQPEWKHSYALSQISNMSSTEMTSDGGFVLTGFSRTGTAARNEWWLQKVGSDGNLQWSRAYAYGNDSWGISACQTADGGYIVLGATGSVNGEGYGSWLVYRLFLVKTDEYGNEEWNKTYAEKSAFIGSVQQATDGGYIMTADSGGIFVTKTYSNGSVQWSRIYSSGGSEEESRLVQGTSDGGYIALAIADFYTFKDQSVSMVRGTVLFKIDEAGNIQWNRTYAGTGEYAYTDSVLDSIQQTSDGGYVLVGTSNSSESSSTASGHAWILKLYPNGNVQWSRTYDAADWSWGTGIRQTSDGGYIAAIEAPWGLSGERVWLWKTDVNGTTLWCKPLSDSVSVSFIQVSADGGYVLGGSDAQLMKVSASPPLFPPEFSAMMYVACGFLLFATITVGFPVSYLSNRKRIVSAYKTWRKGRKRVRGGKKDEILREISKEDLIKLAKAATGGQVSSNTSRAELIRIVKASLSIEEIKSMLRII
jgi:hypothetical protein